MLDTLACAWGRYCASVSIRHCWNASAMCWIFPLTRHEGNAGKVLLYAYVRQRD